MRSLQILLSTVLANMYMRQQRSRIVVLLLCLLIIGVSGCNGTTSNPTGPAVEPSSSPSPEPKDTEEPDKERTPDPDNGTCDSYADSIDDLDLPILEIDDIPITIEMECAGDVDWYKIQLPETPVKLEILLTDLVDDNDFDLTLYDSQKYELENGRSTQSGNSDESLSLVVEDSFVYLQIYSYSGRGKATLTITAGETEELGKEPAEETEENVEEGAEEVTEEDGGDASADDASADATERSEEENIEQSSYEELLSTTFWFYPRGTGSALLERSVETAIVEPISCQFSDTEVTGELTIVNYAHVERDLFESTDYVDGWVLVVFNGSKSLLDMLSITIRTTIVAAELEVEVTAPSRMETRGDDYLVSKTSEDVYYLSQTYGDLAGKSTKDLQIFSGVVGELGEQVSSTIFQQQVEVEWEIEDPDNGITCSGQTIGKPIADFELKNLLLFQK